MSCEACSKSASNNMSTGRNSKVEGSIHAELASSMFLNSDMSICRNSKVGWFNPHSIGQLHNDMSICRNSKVGRVQFT